MVVKLYKKFSHNETIPISLFHLTCMYIEKYSTKMKLQKTVGSLANIPQSAVSLSNEEYLTNSSIQWFQDSDGIHKKAGSKMLMSRIIIQQGLFPQCAVRCVSSQRRNIYSVLLSHRLKIAVVVRNYCGLKLKYPCIIMKYHLVMNRDAILNHLLNSDHFHKKEQAPTRIEASAGGFSFTTFSRFFHDFLPEG